MLGKLFLAILIAAAPCAPAAAAIGEGEWAGSAECNGCTDGSCCSFGPGLYWEGPWNGWAARRRCPTYAGAPARFYVDVEYLALYRDAIHPAPTVTPAPSFDGNYASGVLLTTGVTLAPSYRFEITYFGDHSWSDTAVLANGDPIALRSELNNFEFVLRHRVPTYRRDLEASFSIGGRVMEIEDAIDYNLQLTAAQNDLVGLQAGVLAQFLLYDRTWVDWEVKGAIANNDVDVTGAFQEDVTSFIGETSVVLNHQFLPSLTLRMGYRGIWTTGLALAVENLNMPLETDHSGEMVYHGLNVGLVWSR